MGGGIPVSDTNLLAPSDYSKVRMELFEKIGTGEYKIRYEAALTFLQLAVAAVVDGADTGFNTLAKIQVLIEELQAGVDINWQDFVPQTTLPSYKIGRIFYEEAENTWTAWNDIEGIGLQLGEELRARLVNDTGSTLLNGAAVAVTGAVGTSLKVELLDASDLDSAIRGFGLITLTVVDGSPTYAVRYGAVRELNTVGIAVGSVVYGDPDTLGGWTSTRPKAPNYPVRLGLCLVEHATQGVIAVDTLAFNGSDTSVNSEGTLNGVVIDTPQVDFYTSGGNIWVEITNQRQPTKDLAFMLDGVRYLLNTTTGGGPNNGAYAQLVAGADSETLFENYMYIWLNAGVPQLKVDTLATSDERAEIGKVSLFDVTRTLSEGVYKFRRSNDAPDNGISDGFNRWMADALRDKLGTTYWSGIDPTAVVNSTPSVTVATTTGIATQAHRSSFDLQDGTKYWVYNDNANQAVYDQVADLATIVETAAGVSLAVNGAYYRLPVYGMQNSASGGALSASDKLIVTRPLGFYANAASALVDASNFDVRPNDIKTEGVLFKICTLVISRTSGGGSTWTLIDTIDNRTRLIGGSGGGGADSGGGTDDKVRVTATDTVNGYLDPKFTVGDEFTKETVLPTGNASLLIKFKGWIFNTARTFKHILSSSATADRTQTLQDKNGTIALSEDFAKTNVAAVAPAVTNDNTEGYAVESRWVDTVTGKEYVCTDATTGAAVWTETTQSGGNEFLDGDFQIKNTTDPTKIATLSATKIQTGQTKQYQFPANSGELIAVSAKSKTYSSSPIFTYADGMYQVMPVTGNVTPLISGIPFGGKVVIAFKIDSTGGHTITLGASFGTKRDDSFADITSAAADATYFVEIEKDDSEVYYRILGSGTGESFGGGGSSGGHTWYLNDVEIETTARAKLNVQDNGEIPSVVDDGTNDQILYYLYLANALDYDPSTQQAGDAMCRNAANDGFEPVAVIVDEKLTEPSVEPSLSADGLLDVIIPAGYKIESIIVNETASNAAGNISIGTAASGTQVVNAFAVVADDDKIMTLVADYFSSVNDTDLYVSSSAWGTGVIDLTFVFQQVI